MVQYMDVSRLTCASVVVPTEVHRYIIRNYKRTWIGYEEMKDIDMSPPRC